MDHKPLLVALSAPSGAGKSTICKLLVERHPQFVISVSATTRPPRQYEREGVHYYFLGKGAFFEKVQQGDFLEYEEVHGNYYGTLKSVVDDLRRQGRSVLFDIDVNGALNIKQHDPEAILIFIRPPSVAELRRRLLGRKSENTASIEKRLERLPREYARAESFDYNIVNDDLERAVREIETIIRNHSA
ncbi:MAG: guanylate kinase [Calditrichaeota bacterium]|nr:guanylate kinase [Calditrichota bacterium]